MYIIILRFLPSNITKVSLLNSMVSFKGLTVFKVAYKVKKLFKVFFAEYYYYYFFLLRNWGREFIFT